MFLLPLLRLAQGECVDAFPAPSEGEALPLTDPREVAVRFQGAGAVGLHIVDVDAATGRPPNDEALVSVLDAVRIPVQCGGGVHSLKRIQELRDTGVRRVVVGSMGVLHQDWMQEAARCFPEGLVANLDAKDGRVWIKGRTQDSGQSLEALAMRFDGFGLEGLILTQLNGDGHAPLLALAKQLKTPVMVSTRIRDAAELLAFQTAGAKGVILGPEIYDRTLDFAAVSKAFKSP